MGTEAIANALVFPAPARHEVVEELSKLLAVDQNFRQRLAVELTNLESFVRTERIPLANFLIQDVEEHYVGETC